MAKKKSAVTKNAPQRKTVKKKTAARPPNEDVLDLPVTNSIPTTIPPPDEEEEEVVVPTREEEEPETPSEGPPEPARAEEPPEPLETAPAAPEEPVVVTAPVLTLEGSLLNHPGPSRTGYPDPAVANESPAATSDLPRIVQESGPTVGHTAGLARADFGDKPVGDHGDLVGPGAVTTRTLQPDEKVPMAMAQLWDSMMGQVSQETRMAIWEIGIADVQTLLSTPKRNLVRPRGRLTQAMVAEIDAWFAPHGFRLPAAAVSVHRAVPAVVAGGGKKLATRKMTAALAANRKDWLSKMKKGG